jgi:hypothetical protein
VDATYALRNGQIQEAPVTAAIAALLKMEELKAPSFDSMDGNLHVKNGAVMFSSDLEGAQMAATASGTVGLNGTLDVPLTIHLSQALTEKLLTKLPAARHLTDDKGEATLKLKLAGTLQKPYPTLDSSAVTEQVTETLKEKASQELGKALSGKDEKKRDAEGNDQQDSSGQKLIKGIFGR